MTSEYDGRRVVVAGLGVTGVAVADVLLDRGALVSVVSDRDGEAEQRAATALRERGALVRLGDAVTPLPADLVVASPGFRPDQPLVAAAAAAGIDVIGEPELAWRLRGPAAAPWLGITGTNGKTTTVGMLESILQAAGFRAVAAGNVGLPLVSAVTADPGYDVLAVEVSSAQLQWSPSLRFEAAAILNISEDHLDWHDTFAAYVAAKQRIWIDAVAVGNLDDSVVHGLLPSGGVGFSVSSPAADYTAVGGELVETATGRALIRATELAVVGPHNVSNALAAAAVARVHGVPVAAVRDGLAGFRPGRHRQEPVASRAGVDWVDDSKATNPHAAAASLAAYPSVVWIAGGLLKGADVGPLVAEHGHRLRAAILLGKDRAQIVAALARHAPDVPVVEVDASDTGGMDLAVRAAARVARAGDTVLLAPAAASWDMFRDYADRGDRFAAAARSLDTGSA
ncbi:MAG TPA: UDP-N-acetylmuramoyl-L-alanine--D-glutamate ligase [Mycobacteriales bacterium]|nr:UDP-N-acetylmuramoyl-L-alanine--D-glutamate ligase [Mycobacteriales bacterium]